MDGLRRWFTAHGGVFHRDVELVDDGPFGASVHAPRLGDDTTIVACPFVLVVTRDASSHALTTLCGHAPPDTWSARQLIASYLCFHHIIVPHDVLRHLPYVQSLPRADQLLTSLYFTPPERELLRGTNLYGATLERERDWRAEWAQCHSLVQNVNPAWADAFTCELYMTAATHLSSRAFPSSILLPVPSLGLASPSTEPVLIPGLDLLNHKRAHPVSWIVSCQDASAPDTISLVAHPERGPDADTASGQDALVEVFNNYGPKPNDELILGYGFSIADNPDDTIALQIGALVSAPSQTWLVGRHARNVDRLWSDIRNRIANGQCEHAFEDDLDTAVTLSDMVQAKLDRIKTLADVRQSVQIRPMVRRMLEHYVSGQRDILESILEFASEKQQAAIKTAREQGIDVVFDDDV